MAVLVLAAQGNVQYDTFLFANVGDDSENPDTLTYYRSIAQPYAEMHGLDLREVKRTANGGMTLYTKTMWEERSIKIPVRMGNGAPGARTCTQDFKRSVIRKALGPGQHVVGLGISLDEFHRMRTDSSYKNIVNEYPLIDLRLRRSDCQHIISEAGLPVPPKSSCWFCPFHSRTAWIDLKAKHPDLFGKAVVLEAVLNAKRSALGRDTIYLHSSARPLAVAVGEQVRMFEEDTCESGYCMT